MFLRSLDGAYKGEIREFPPEVARALLAAGRAENPYAEPVIPVPIADPAAPLINLMSSTSKASKKARK